MHTTSLRSLKLNLTLGATMFVLTGCPDDTTPGEGADSGTASSGGADDVVDDGDDGDDGITITGVDSSGDGGTTTSTPGTSDGGSTDAGSDATDGGSDTGATGTDSGSSGTDGTGGSVSVSGSGSEGGAVCGDDAVEGAEVCDGADLAGQTCISQGFDAGVLACQDDCTGYDISACVDTTDDCCTANGTPGCGDPTCEAAVCLADAFCCDDTWDDQCGAEAAVEPACVGVGGSCPALDICGNNIIEVGETCDGNDLDGQTCVTEGFDGGALACLDDCSGVDTSACEDFGGDCCAANGTPGCDDVACTTAICAFDDFCCTDNWDNQCATEAAAELACVGAGGSCPAADVCGNNLAETGEICDGDDLADATCVTEGFDGGTLTCLGDCSGVDTSACGDFGGDCCAANGSIGCDDPGCTAAICAFDDFCCLTDWDEICANEAALEPACLGVGGSCADPDVCGNNFAETGEICDGPDLVGLTCISEGFDGGVLACLGDCSDVDTTSCLTFGGDCCAANGTIGCDDEGCTTAVCALDPFCCNNTWDTFCADGALGEPACAGVGGSCP